MKKTIRLSYGILILTLICLVLSSCGIVSLIRKEKETETAAQQTTESIAEEVSSEEVTTKEAATEPTTIDDESRIVEVEDISIDADIQYAANIFLSNFAEQSGFTDFDDTSYDGRQLIDFVHRYAKINATGAITYEGMYEVFTLDYVQEVLGRFFGLTITEPDYIDLPAPTYSYEIGTYYGPYYKDGKFYYPAADGETYIRFAVVYDIIKFPDGHLMMAFNRYDRLDFDTVGGLAVSDAHYHLTLAEAEADPNLQNMGNGFANVYPKVYGGRNTYQLISYHEYMPGGIEN